MKNIFSKLKTGPVLVTGCSGDIGHSIGKILKMENCCEMTIGTDIKNEHAAFSLFDKCVVVPKASDDNYLTEFSKIISKYRPSLIIPTSEQELKFFHKFKLSQIESTPLIMANEHSMQIGFDKYLTYQFLKENHLPFPWTTLTSNKNPDSLPCICKGREGAGSKNVAIIYNQQDIDYFSKKGDDLIWQELLLPDDEEYTCGIFRSKHGEIRTIAFKRKLEGGHTKSGVLRNTPAITDVLTKIATGLELRGCINVQLRNTSKGAVVFEINPRFSSTVLFRHLLNFQDLLWSMADTLNLPIPHYEKRENGIKFYRINDELICP